MRISRPHLAVLVNLIWYAGNCSRMYSKGSRWLVRGLWVDLSSGPKLDIVVVIAGSVETAEAPPARPTRRAAAAETRTRTPRARRRLRLRPPLRRRNHQVDAALHQSAGWATPHHTAASGPNNRPYRSIWPEFRVPVSSLEPVSQPTFTSHSPARNNPPIKPNTAKQTVEPSPTCLWFDIHCFRLVA